eukprot:272188_1
MSSEDDEDNFDIRHKSKLIPRFALYKHQNMNLFMGGKGGGGGGGGLGVTGTSDRSKNQNENKQNTIDDKQKESQTIMRNPTNTSKINSNKQKDIPPNKAVTSEETPLLKDTFIAANTIDGIKSFLDDKDELDIYQLVAFRVKTGCHNNKYAGYWLDIIKAAICIFTQFVSVIVLYLYTFETVKKESDKGWCDAEGELKSRLMAIAYTLFLSSILYTTFMKNQNAGFYLHLEYESYDYSFISSEWLHFGRIFNGLLILNAFYLSFLITFFTEDPLNIVLNAVALLFIAEIDNMVIDRSDYTKTLSWFKNEKNTQKITKDPMNNCKMYFWNCMMNIERALGHISLLCVCVVPFLVAICY